MGEHTATPWRLQPKNFIVGNERDDQADIVALLSDSNFEKETNLMCCCGKPVINGQPGYRWQPNDAPRIRPVNPPALLDGETLIRDEPGRCGGLDSHCHHFRLVASGSGRYTIVVRHGGGDERVPIHYPEMDAISKMDSTSCYWIMRAIQGAYSDGRRNGQQATELKWITAAMQQRIKTRKMRGYDQRKVWIVPAAA